MPKKATKKTTAKKKAPKKAAAKPKKVAAKKTAKPKKVAPAKKVVEPEAPAIEKEEVLVTRSGLKKLQEELENLRTVRRKEVAARLQEAISYGDLSENSEYEEAKNEQAFIEGRIIDLEKKVKNAKIIRDTHARTVQIGSKVKIRQIGSRKDAETYLIVGTTEADPFENKISNESPIGSAIIDKSVGDKVEVSVPAGAFKFEILDLK
jgi:transcription elongation factor GreA